MEISEVGIDGATDTCALCKKCHSMVTYSNSAKARFTKKFTELGYSVNDVTGDIVCGNAGDV
jgi:hypothetical protein